MNSLKERLFEISNEAEIVPILNYYPILRYNGLGLYANLVLSYVIGWNVNGKDCFISKEKLSQYYEISTEEVDIIVRTLLVKDFISSKLINYKGGKTKVFHVNMDNVEKSIIESSAYKSKLKIINIKKDLAEAEANS